MNSSRTFGLILIAAATASARFTFGPGVQYAAGNGPLVTVTGDFYNTGLTDLAVRNAASNSVYKGDGAGLFSTSLQVQLQAAVSVVSAVMTPGSAELYQIAIQLPSQMATAGALAIQASVGGVLSPSGVQFYVSAQ